MLKSGLTQRKVSERLGIPMRTLRDWKAAASNLDKLTKNIKKGWKELGRDTDYLERLTNSRPSSLPMAT